MGVINAIGRAVGSVFGGGGGNPAAAGGKPVSAAEAARFAGMMSAGAAPATGTSGASPWAPAGALPGATGLAGAAGIGPTQSRSAMPAQVALPIDRPQAGSESMLGPASGQTQEAQQQAEREAERDEEVREHRAEEKQRASLEQTEEEVRDKTEVEAVDRAEAGDSLRDERRLQDRRLVQGEEQVLRADAEWQRPGQPQDPAVRAGR
ncbi:MAG: hypothetical protein ING59_10550 [Burkholderiales bacterium]|nr:hypothetical protein [Burkholderiales bacterium]